MKRSNYIKLTLLCDNLVERPHLLAEHGLSFLIETEKRNILFDTGQGLAINHNAKKLNIDLRSVDAVILSHGHYDHTGGLREILKEQGKADVYAHPHILKPKYKKLKTGKMRYIGCPRSLLDKAITALRDFSIQQIVLSHCTGIAAFNLTEQKQMELFPPHKLEKLKKATEKIEEKDGGKRKN